MIFKSFLLGNLLGNSVSLCMKIINSVVVVGLYYGFLTTFSIGPSYFFLLRAHVMQEGSEKKVSATTGFIMGQLVMFISIYYAPLHLALGRPHTITFLALPYLFFTFLAQEYKEYFLEYYEDFFNYGSTTRNSIRNLSIQCVFLNNLIFQLFNHFILPSSTLARLVNIYMFRCDNKTLFVTSSFVGWLIGQILFMKHFGFVLVWLRQNYSITLFRPKLILKTPKLILSEPKVFLKTPKIFLPKAKLILQKPKIILTKLIRTKKYIVSEFIYYMDRIFFMSVLIICINYLGRIPYPLLTRKLDHAPKQRYEYQEVTFYPRVNEGKEKLKRVKRKLNQGAEGFSNKLDSRKEKKNRQKINEMEDIRASGKENTKDEFNKETCYKNTPTFQFPFLKDIFKLKKFKFNKKWNLFQLKWKLFQLKWNDKFKWNKNKKLNKKLNKTTKLIEKLNSKLNEKLIKKLKKVNKKWNLFQLQWNEKLNDNEKLIENWNKKWNLYQFKRNRKLTENLIKKLKKVNKNKKLIENLNKNNKLNKKWKLRRKLFQLQWKFCQFKWKLYQLKRTEKLLNKNWNKILIEKLNEKLIENLNKKWNERLIKKSFNKNWKLYELKKISKLNEKLIEQRNEQFNKKWNLFQLKWKLFQLKWKLRWRFFQFQLNKKLTKLKSKFQSEKPLIILLFDLNRWNRPLRYIKNYRFENAVRNEITSQYYFYTCQSYGKKRISFTFPLALSSWFKRIQKKIQMPLSIIEKLSSDKLYNDFVSTNEQKSNDLKNEFITRFKAINKRLRSVNRDKRFKYMDILEKRVRFGTSEEKYSEDQYFEEEYFYQKQDPFLNGPYRAKIRKGNLPAEGVWELFESVKRNFIKSRKKTPKAKTGFKRRKVHKLAGLLFSLPKYKNSIPLEIFLSEMRKVRKEKEILKDNGKKPKLKLRDSSFFKRDPSLDSQKQKNDITKTLINFQEAGFYYTQDFIEKLKKKLGKITPRWLYKFITEQKFLEGQARRRKHPEIRSRRYRRLSIQGTEKENPFGDLDEYPNLNQGKKKKTKEDTFEDVDKYTNLNQDKNQDGKTKEDTFEDVDKYTNLNQDKNQEKKEQEQKEKEKKARERRFKLLDHFKEPDFRRYLVTGSMRTLRSKTPMLKTFQSTPHSVLFLERIENYLWVEVSRAYLFISKVIIVLMHFISIQLQKIRGRVVRTEFKIEKKTSEEIEAEKKARKEFNETNKEEGNAELTLTREEEQFDAMEQWEANLAYGAGIRSCILLMQVFIRKNVLFPLLIMFKNIGRILLLQPSEWDQDFTKLRREIYIICLYNGVVFSETQYPQDWFSEGIQIKILFPFYLRPWHKSKPRPSSIDRMNEKAQKDKINKNEEKNQKEYYLTAGGRLTDFPFGPAQDLPVFFKPVLYELAKKIRKFKRKRAIYLVLKVFKKGVFFLKRLKRLILRILRIIIIIIIKLSQTKINISWRKEPKSSEIEKKEDSTIHKNKIDKPLTQIKSRERTKKKLLAEKKIKDLTDKTSTTRNEIERITKEKKKKTPGITVSPNKISYNAKIFESLKKNWQIVKKNKTRLILIHKLHCFVKFFTKKIYRNIFLAIIKIVQKKFSKATSNTNPDYFLNLISTSNESLSKGKADFFDLSSLSQAYVFYKLSETRVLNLDKLISTLQSHRRSFFLKTSIKNYFRTKGIIHSKLKHKKLHNLGITQWKNWLRGHYQYDLSQIIWSRLRVQKWRNQCCTIQNQDLTNEDSYEKDQVIDYQNYYKNNFQKYYRYNIFSSRSIYYENKKDPYIYGSPFQIKKKPKNFYNYNTLKDKHKGFHRREDIPINFDILGDIPINNYLEQRNISDITDIVYMKKNSDRNYFNATILDFWVEESRMENLDNQYIDLEYRRKAAGWIKIENWIKSHTNNHKNTKTQSKIFHKVEQKDLFYLNLRIPQNEVINSPNHEKTFLDWMGMNEEIQSRNPQPYPSPVFELLYLSNLYKRKPWVIPTKFLFFNFPIQKRDFELIREHRRATNTIGKTKGFSIPGNDLKSITKIRQKDENAIFVLSKSPNQEKKDYSQFELALDIQKASDAKQRKKPYVKFKHTPWRIALYNFFLFQADSLDDNFSDDITTNIKILSLISGVDYVFEKYKRVTFSYIRKKQLNLDLVTVSLPQFLPTKKALLTGRILVEPCSLSINVTKSKNFIMYQTIGISLLHKSRHQVVDTRKYKKYREQRFVEDYEGSILRNHQRITGNFEINHYDLFIPENILLSKRRRELRILLCFNSKTEHGVARNPIFFKRKKVKNWDQFCFYNTLFHSHIYLDLHSNFHFFNKKKWLLTLYKLNLERDQLMKFKCFLWPNYRLEDLACMNRYWFDTNNGSRFSMLRIKMYPQL
uniref:hypothetical protein RF1 n=1 Tax=Clematoclethra scandens TaxID=448037 RepID=UPI0022DCDFB1|nr:hypothetical protein RF1 [Clematoclethra scandens]UZT28285.1 hypothetical protein RF1 [Clematoclethra scandens]